MPIKREGGGEVQNWLKEAMKEYNFASFENRNSYPAVIHMPGKILDKVIKWCFESLPDEVLVGIDVDNKSPINQEVSLAFCNQGSRADLFAGQDYVIGEAEIVNRGDSFSVHHLPEDWTDGIFTESRGARGGRFTHWLHTHPNAVAIPSSQDADAAQSTLGVDLILGVEFSPEGPFGWYEDVEGVRRPLGNNRVSEEGSESKPSHGDSSAGWRRKWWKKKNQRQVLGISPTGHSIHGLELIAFHKSGVGVNVVLVDEEGIPYGWPFEK